MRPTFLALAALLFAAAPATAADPPIVFQVQPAGQVIDNLRTAATLVGGEKGTKAFNNALKDGFGEKGLDGFDIGRPIVGYVILAPKPSDITAVIALPITGEKEFLDLCDRVNREKLRVDAKDKTLYHLPPLEPQYKAMMRFSDQYAYIAYGANPAPHIEAKALVAMPKLYDANERGLIAARVHFDRIPDDVRKAAPALFAEVKQTLFGGGRGMFGIGRQELTLLNPVTEGFDKLLTRYTKLASGADVLTARLYLDPQAGNLVAEATLTGKPGSDVAKIIAARKPTTNKFAAIANHPDTAAAFTFRMPLLEVDEIRTGAAAGLKNVGKELVSHVPGAGKDAAEELFKGLIRTVKTGEFDVVVGVRGPDKDGTYTLVGALAFEDAAPLGKEFRKFAEKDAPQKVLDAIKWDADKVGDISIHTWSMKGEGFLTPGKVFGGDDCVLAFAFAPHGIIAAMGPDPVKVVKEALAAKPGTASLLDLMANPTRMRKFIQKIAQNDPETQDMAEMFGKEDKLGSVMSLTVNGGQELKVKFTIDLRVLPRLLLKHDIDRAARDADPDKK